MRFLRSREQTSMLALAYLGALQKLCCTKPRAAGCDLWGFEDVGYPGQETGADHAVTVWRQVSACGPALSEFYGRSSTWNGFDRAQGTRGPIASPPLLSAVP